MLSSCESISALLPEFVGEEVPFEVSSHLLRCELCSTNFSYYQMIHQEFSDSRGRLLPADEMLLQDITASVYSSCGVVQKVSKKKRFKVLGGVAAVATAGVGAIALGWKFVDKQRLVG